MVARGRRADAILHAAASPPDAANVPHTVSGFSSGGIMALAHVVALSASVLSVSSNAGGLILPQAAYEMLAGDGAVDPLENLRRVRVHLYRGGSDTVVPAQFAIGMANRSLGALGVPAEHVFIQSEPHAPHSVVVSGDPQAQPCSHQGPQWINDCGSGFELYRTIFPFVLGRPPLPAAAGAVRPARYDYRRLFLLEQGDFLPFNVTLGGARLGETALVYVPSGCGEEAASEGKPACPIHVDYHGCYMADEGEQFPPVPESRAQHLQYYLQHTGQWDYAEAYKVVVLNPRVASTPRGNALACWPVMLTKRTPALAAVVAMLAFLGTQLAGGTLRNELASRAPHVGSGDAEATHAVLPPDQLAHDLSEHMHPRTLIDILRDDLVTSNFGLEGLLSPLLEVIDDAGIGAWEDAAL